MACRFVRSAVTETAAGRIDPLKVPSSIPYGENRVRGRHIFSDHPCLVEPPLLQKKPVRQKGAGAKKDRRHPYHEGLPEFPAFAGILTESPACGFSTGSGVMARSGLMAISVLSALVSGALPAGATAASSGRVSPEGNIEVLPDRVDK